MSDRRAQDRADGKPDDTVQNAVGRLSGRAASRAKNGDAARAAVLNIPPTGLAGRHATGFRGGRESVLERVARERKLRRATAILANRWAPDHPAESLASVRV